MNKFCSKKCLILATFTQFQKSSSFVRKNRNFWHEFLSEIHHPTSKNEIGILVKITNTQDQSFFEQNLSNFLLRFAVFLKVLQASFFPVSVSFGVLSALNLRFEDIHYQTSNNRIACLALCKNSQDQSFFWVNFEQILLCVGFSLRALESYLFLPVPFLFHIHMVTFGAQMTVIS